MIEYIYFVKCPDCEDEPFDFFDEAKDFAMGCLSHNPIITQVEVDRNDFGECTDSCDLGTVWSWEDIVKETETEPAASVFTKDSLSANTEDSEFDDDVFKVFNDLIKDEYEAIDGYESAEDLISQYDFSSEDKDLILSTLAHIKAEEEEHIDELEKLPYKNTKSDARSNSCCKEPRVPIPEGMTIKELVEEMEENEDTVECSWCEDLFDKSECRYELDLGWLCSRCQAAIMSRGETLTFRENNYWDFLDEDIDLDTEETPELLTWICEFDGQEIGTVEAVTEEEALTKMMSKYPEYHYGEYDGCFSVYPEEDEEEPKSMLEELEDADTYRERLTLCPECGGITFDNETSMCINCGFNVLTEDTVSDKIEAACKEKVALDYFDIEVTGMGAKRDVDDWDEWTESRDFTYTVDKQDVIETLFDYLQEEDVADIGGLKAFEELSDEDAWLYMIDHFDELFEKYEQQLLKYYEDRAAEAAQDDYNERSAWE